MITVVVASMNHCYNSCLKSLCLSTSITTNYSNVTHCMVYVLAISTAHVLPLGDVLLSLHKLINLKMPIIIEHMSFAMCLVWSE